MRSRDLLVLAGTLALVGTSGDSLFGQRGGRGGMAAGGRSSGSAVVGPYGGGGTSSRSSGTVVGPAGGSRTVGAGGGSYTTGRGTTINHGGVGGTATGPGGATAGRGVGGVQVTTPGGATGTRVGTVGGVSGARGSAVTASRGGVAVGPGGAIAGGTRVGAATGPGGRTVAGASPWTAASNPYGAYASASRGVAVGRAGRSTTYRSAAVVQTQARYVRSGFRGYNYFNPGWYRVHAGAWRVAAWAPTAYWAWAPYTTIVRFCGYPVTPVIYDYGSNIVYQDNRVYFNGEPVATADEYAAQALDLASAGLAVKPDEHDEWQPLGVFAMVQDEEKDANNIFQIAINKDGVIRGNYYNGLTDQSVPIYGSVDRKTQRAAWIIGEKKETVYETGVGNLAQPETSMLVHFGKDRTQQWTLVRLEPPQEVK